MQKTIINYPSEWQEQYKEEDKEAVRMIVDWLNAGNEKNIVTRTQAKLASMSSVNKSIVSAILGGKYKAPVSQKLELILDSIESVKIREDDVIDVPYVDDTSVFKLVRAVCERARKYRNYGVIAGYVGSGKTSALQHYCKLYPSAVYIRAIPNMSAGVFIDALIKILKVPVNGRFANAKQDKKLESIIEHIKGTERLIILDEAEYAGDKALDTSRHIRDEAGIGIVLTGTEKLIPRINKEHGRFDQIRSRVGMWPKLIERITVPDCRKILESAFSLETDVEISEKIVHSFYKCCGGSARTLVEGIIPGVRDFGLKKGRALTPKLIKQVTEEAMGLQVGAL